MQLLTDSPYFYYYLKKNKYNKIEMSSPTEIETFDIVSWNPIYINGEIVNACVYIKPTLNLLQFFQDAVMNNVLMNVTGTNSQYDNKIVFGTIDRTSDMQTSRTNFFNDTGLYMVTMDHIWKGYPMHNGKIHFYTGIVDKILN